MLARSLFVLLVCLVVNAHADDTQDRTVRGLVTDENGKPIADALVQLFASTALTTPIKEARSGLDGKYVILTPPLSALRVFGDHWRVEARSPRRMVGGYVADVKANGGERIIDFMLAPAAFIQGKITGSDGSARKGAHVSLWQGEELAHTTTDEKGSYLFDALTHFDGHIVAKGGRDEVAMAPVRVIAPKSSTTDLQLSAPDDPRVIRLDVVDDQNKPVAGASLGLRPVSWRTDASGHWFGLRFYPSSLWATMIYVGDCPIAYVNEAVAPSPFRVIVPTGSVKVEQWRRYGNESRLLREIDGALTEVRKPHCHADSDLSVIAFLPAGRYRYLGEQEGIARALSFELSAGERKEITEVPPADASATATARVLDKANGRGLPGAAISARCLSVRLLQDAYSSFSLGFGECRATTDKDGNATISGLSPGTHVAEITAPDHLPLTVALHTDTPQSFRLVPGKKKAGYDQTPALSVLCGEKCVVSSMTQEIKGLSISDVIVAIDAKPAAKFSTDEVDAILADGNPHRLLLESFGKQREHKWTPPKKTVGARE